MVTNPEDVMAEHHIKLSLSSPLQALARVARPASEKQNWLGSFSSALLFLDILRSLAMFAMLFLCIFQI